LYRRSRQIGWAISQAQYTAKRAETPKESQQVQPAEPMPLIQEANPIKPGTGPTLEQSKAGMQDKATTVKAEIYRRSAAPSRLSRASSAPLKQQDQRLVPPPPKEAGEGKDFVCPYCCLILQSREVWNREAWV
jgi:hypothetical protein